MCAEIFSHCAIAAVVQLKTGAGSAYLLFIVASLGLGGLVKEILKVELVDVAALLMHWVYTLFSH